MQWDSLILFGKDIGAWAEISAVGRTYRRLRKVFSTCGNLSALAETYQHLRLVIGTRKNLQALAPSYQRSLLLQPPSSLPRMAWLPKRYPLLKSAPFPSTALLSWQAGA